MDPSIRYSFIDPKDMFSPEEADIEPSLESICFAEDRGLFENIPGLYQIGVPWQQRADSGLIHGVGAGKFIYLIFVGKLKKRKEND